MLRKKLIVCIEFSENRVGPQRCTFLMPCNSFSLAIKRINDPYINILCIYIYIYLNLHKVQTEFRASTICL